MPPGTKVSEVPLITTCTCTCIYAFPRLIFFPLYFIVVDSEEPNWLLATNTKGKRGLVPANYVEILL